MYERLTMRRDNEVFVNSEATGWTHNSNWSKPAQEAIDRLAAYEDSELSPEEVQELAQAKTEKESSEYVVEAIGSEAKHIIDLLRAEAEGRLAVLQCKVGDTVYQLRSKRHAHGKGISPRIVSCVVIYADGDYALSHQGMTDCIKKELGKTWFLTREAAEKALGVGE